MAHPGAPRRLLRTESSQFRRILQTAPRHRGQFIDLLTASSVRPGPALGMVVPKRVCRLAVRRNLIKRAMRETFRRHWQALPEADWVFRLRRLPDTPLRQAVRDDLRRIVHDLAS